MRGWKGSFSATIATSSAISRSGSAIAPRSRISPRKSTCGCCVSSARISSEAPRRCCFGVASNAVYEWRLLARNRLPHSPTELEGLESIESGPSADIWRAELAHALTAALERLSPKCRAAVVLHRREQLTYSEVGVQLGISVAMVKKYLSQGVALCRGHLRERLGLAADEGDK